MPISFQTFDENSTLRGVLEELIVPSVQRKELALREKGLECLGLCCLIAKVRSTLSFTGAAVTYTLRRTWRSVLSSCFLVK